MTPAEIDLARRIVACGLPVPTSTSGDGGIAVKWDTEGPNESGFFARQWACELEPGETCRPFGITPSAGILFVCVATDTGPELLPVLDDYALLGWLITELERVAKSRCDIFEMLDGWCVQAEGWRACEAPTRIEALLAALEAAKAAK